MVLFALYGTAATLGMAKGEHVTSAELLTSAQRVRVIVPTTEPGVRIFLEQVEPTDERAKDLPNGYVVANVQIFRQPQLETDSEKKMKPEQYASAMAKLESEDEMHSFSPALTILLWKTSKKEGNVDGFGLLAKNGVHKGWVFWDPKGNRDTQIKKFREVGFTIDFFEGNPGKVLVSEWPPGDPCVGH
jgi:hypothetical protein